MYEEYLIEHLKERSDFDDPSLENELRIRAMMNRVLPSGFDEGFYQRQDAYLQDLLARKTVVDVNELEYKDGIALYRGDITLLKADAIVNAGNPQLLGCFSPLHSCIDNCIHSYAGLEVRRDLMEILQGREVENATVVVTKGYNLPAQYIFHTVGPVYQGIKRNDLDLSLCYARCMDKASEMGLKSIVFCSLSTGVYGFPIEKACRIAIKTVKFCLLEKHYDIKVVFDVFSKNDEETYGRAMSED